LRARNGRIILDSSGIAFQATDRYGDVSRGIGAPNERASFKQT
jgi:hypothetical protein